MSIACAPTSSLYRVELRVWEATVPGFAVVHDLSRFICVSLVLFILSNTGAMQI